MLKQLLTTITIFLLSTNSFFSQRNIKDTVPYYRYYTRSSALLLVNSGANSPSFYQVNLGYSIYPQDVILIKAIEYENGCPIGIPHSQFYDDDRENYSEIIREYDIGAVYQRFLWRGL